jgi:ATP-binding cassette subfamily C protein CydCD
VLELVATIAVALVAVTIGVRLAAGSVDLQTALVVLLLAPEAYWPLRRMGAEFHAAAEGTATLEATADLSRDVTRVGRDVTRVGRDVTDCHLGRPERRLGMVLDGVGLTFPGRERPALMPVSATVPDRGITAIVGPSGCGKSTLLLLVAGLLEPAAGTVAVGGHASAAGRLRRCALMPQRDGLLPWRTALDNVAIPLENAGAGRRAARERAAPVLDRLGVGEFAGARPAHLSGGMRQRVAFGRTVIAGKDVLLLDEPFGALDALTRASVQEWLRDELAGAPRTVLLVTHDVEEALYLCDRVAVLSPRPGRVVEMLDVAIERAGSRREVVTSPAFAALRERTLEALA